jgi:hypothetical protein
MFTFHATLDATFRAAFHATLAATFTVPTGLQSTRHSPCQASCTHACNGRDNRAAVCASVGSITLLTKAYWKRIDATEAIRLNREFTQINANPIAAN